MNKLKNALLAIVTAVAIFSLSSCTEEAVADFEYTLTDQTVQVTFTGSGDDLEYLWEFGEEATYTTASPSHTFINDEVHTIKLTVTNDKGSDETSQQVEIELPSADRSLEYMVISGDAVFYGINENKLVGVEVESKAFGRGTYFDESGNPMELVRLDMKYRNKSNRLEFDASEMVYLHEEDAQETQGIGKNAPAEWNTQGNSEWPSINGLSNVVPIPTVTELDHNGAVNISEAFEFGYIDDAQNVEEAVFSIYGPDATLVQRVTDGSKMASFTAAEMATLGNGYGYIQVEAYNKVSQLLSGKRFFAVNGSYTYKRVRLTPQG